jgi:hypothetical protein
MTFAAFGIFDRDPSLQQEVVDGSDLSDDERDRQAVYPGDHAARSLRRENHRHRCAHRAASLDQARSRQGAACELMWSSRRSLKTRTLTLKLPFRPCTPARALGRRKSDGRTSSPAPTFHQPVRSSRVSDRNVSIKCPSLTSTCTYVCPAVSFLQHHAVSGRRWRVTWARSTC